MSRNEFIDVDCLSNLFNPPDSNKVLEQVEFKEDNYEAKWTKWIMDRQDDIILGLKAFREVDFSRDSCVI